MSDYKTLRQTVKKEPIPTPDEIRGLKKCLEEAIVEAIANAQTVPPTTLVSSNSLANRFIYRKWNIRPSQRKRYANLYAQVRRKSRELFKRLLKKGVMNLEDEPHGPCMIMLSEFDDIRGNLIAKFERLN